jgi:hypothetical protein
MWSRRELEDMCRRAGISPELLADIRELEELLSEIIFEVADDFADGEGPLSEEEKRRFKNEVARRLGEEINRRYHTN